MNYYEFVANQGKVLFNMKLFNYGNRIISKEDISGYLVEMNKEDAEQYANLYQQESKEIEEAIVKKETDIRRARYNQKQKGIVLMNEISEEEEIANATAEENERLNIIKKDIIGSIYTSTEISKMNIQVIKH